MTQRPGLSPSDKILIAAIGAFICWRALAELLILAGAWPA